MNALLVSLLRRKSIGLLLCVVLACDTLGPDDIDPENQFTFSQTEFYTLPASAIVIDVKAILEKSLVRGSLTIAGYPTRGTLTRMDAFVFKYTPTIDFTGRQDQFTFGAVLDDGRIIKGKPMTIYMKSSVAEFPCGVYPVEDDIRMNPIGTVVIHVLQNDRICDVEGLEEVRVHLAPKVGEAVVVGDYIRYTPGPSFSNADEFVYSLSTSNGEEVSFGLVSLNKSNFEIIDIQVGFTSIFFVDDTIGFIAGGSTILKTTDGGGHWSQLTYPAVGNEYIEFESIYFLNKDHGFAGFTIPNSDCPPSDGWAGGGCPWWHMETKDGGESWVVLHPEVSVPIFEFPSPPSHPLINLPYTLLSQGSSPDGDLAVVISGNNWTARQTMTISIGTNQGRTWVETAEQSDGYPWSISVPSSNVAYILCWGKILKYSL